MVSLFGSYPGVGHGFMCSAGYIKVRLKWRLDDDDVIRWLLPQAKGLEQAHVISAYDINLLLFVE